MLINCVAYQDGRKLAGIPIEDIDAWVKKPGCFVWVALRDATDDELHQMQAEFDLPVSERHIPANSESA